MSKKLSPSQTKLLDDLSFDEWKEAPFYTSGNTIISLQDRGLIKIRTPAHIRGRILAGEAVSCPWREYEMIRLRKEP